MTSIASQRRERLAATPLTIVRADEQRGFRAFLASCAAIWGHRQLLVLLVRRQLKARYKDSALGLVWTLIRPFTLFLIYYVAIGQFLGAARGVQDFAIFIFSGLTVWSLYNEILASGTTSIVDNAGLIKKVRIPRELFPLAAVGSALVNFLFQFIVLIAVVLVIGEFPISWDLLYVLGATVLILIWGTLFALALASFNVYLRDTQYLVEVILMVLFWASPIVYAWSFVVGAAERLQATWISAVYLYNPITIAVMAFQKGIWKSGSETVHISNGAGQPDTVLAAQPWPTLWLYMLIFGVIGLVGVYVSQRIFNRLQGNFAQEI